MTDNEKINAKVAHPARRYNYWLGGKDNFGADRESGDQIAKVFPQIPQAAQHNRAFLGRAVQYLAGQGVRQFLDIGTGLPTADNTHEVAQRIAPDSRIVYVDNDPLVLVHARALLNGTPEGHIAYLDGDLREPARILSDPALTDTLNLTRPVALMLIAVLHFIADDDQAYQVVRHLVDALPAGSMLALSHATYDFFDDNRIAALDKLDLGSFTPRTRAQVLRFFDGLELVDPDLTLVTAWRPDPALAASPPDPAEVAWYGAIARKPG
jgi:hypothetical protein